MTPRERVFALERFGVKLGLEHINAILDALGRPERAWRAVHVAGTNGKGSVTAMVERGLRAAGHLTGRYTSPHLDRIEERIAIGGCPVDSGTFDLVAEELLAKVDGLRAAGALEAWPTFFEVTTAMAFEILRRRAVDVGVIEVGLGGRFDATNVLTPVVSAITSIALDHQRHLGATIAEIAFEKAGVAKPGVPLVVGAVPPEAGRVIAEAADRAGAPSIPAGDEMVESCSLERGRATVVLRTPEGCYGPVRLALAGAHQVANAAVAVRTLEVCRARGVDLGAAHILTALADVEWPARLEWLRVDGGRSVLFDAAHNPAGAATLADYIRHAGVAPIPVVLGIMKDKDVAGIVRPLAGVASRFVTVAVGLPRSISAADLADAIAGLAPGVPVEAGHTAEDGIARALGAGTRAVVAGSIFLVGPARARLVGAGAVSLRDAP
jgi:dihydrofolate synthase/folylpolyglutamate synthase